MSEIDDLFEGAASGLLLDMAGEIVTVVELPATPQGAKTTTVGVQVLLRHVNASDALAHQRREYQIPVATISDPKRGMQIVDAAGLTWAVFDVDLAEGGLTPCHARIAQVDA